MGVSSSLRTGATSAWPGSCTVPSRKVECALVGVGQGQSLLDGLQSLASILSHSWVFSLKFDASFSHLNRVNHYHSAK